MKQKLEGYFSIQEACEILDMGYWKFYRTVMPLLESVQPAGKHGQHFFREEAVHQFSHEMETANE